MGFSNNLHPDFKYISAATRERCRIFVVDADKDAQFSAVRTDSFPLLYSLPSLKFTVYLQIGGLLIEFMRPEDFGKEMLDSIWDALNIAHKVMVGLYIKSSDKPQLDALVKAVKLKRFESLKADHPALDVSVLDTMQDLSTVSAQITRGGITPKLVENVKLVAEQAVRQASSNPKSLATLAKMIALSPELYDHSAAVAMFSGVIASKNIKYRLNTSEIQSVVMAALYHDIGKTCIPSSILNKPGKLTIDEFEMMKKHTVLGAWELKQAIGNGARLPPIAIRVAEEHHERFCGGGYPHSKKGRAADEGKDGIHLYSRIVSVADMYGALLSKRCYKEAMSVPDALTLMKRESGKGFEPDLVDMFIVAVMESEIASEIAR